MDPNTNIDDLNTINGKKLINTQEILPDIIGNYFEGINSIENSAKSSLDNIVKKKVSVITSDLNRLEPMTTFNNSNKAGKPTFLSTEISFTNVQEVKTLIKNMSNKTSTGSDQIPNIVLKEIPINCIINYTIIFNHAINNGYFPKAWKTAKLIILKEKRDKETTLDNLRPISLLPVVSKIFEKIINRQIVKYSEDKKIVPDQQFGFKKRHSTIHAISKLLSDINWHLAKDEMTGAGLIDLKKAFDSVWLDGLIFKLNKAGLSKPLLKLITNMVRNRKFKVHINNYTSDKTFNITRGLQKGTVNSPTLFNIFNADTLNLFKLNSGNDCYALAFADDLILYIADKNLERITVKLQELYTKIKNYYLNWKLEINAKKCETILFREPISNKTQTTFKNWRKFSIKDIDNETTIVPHKRTVKYLGVHIDDLLRFNQHIDKQTEKAKKAFKGLHNLFYSPHLDQKAKIIAYQSLIRPILSYACSVWFKISASSMRAFERKCIKVCINKYREPDENNKKRIKNSKIYNLTKIPRLDVFIIYLTRKHTKKAVYNKSNNPINGAFFYNDGYYQTTLPVPRSE